MTNAGNSRTDRDAYSSPSAKTVLSECNWKTHRRSRSSSSLETRCTESRTSYSGAAARRPRRFSSCFMSASLWSDAQQAGLEPATSPRARLPIPPLAHGQCTAERLSLQTGLLLLGQLSRQPSRIDPCPREQLQRGREGGVGLLERLALLAHRHHEHGPEEPVHERSNGRV